VLDKVAIIGYSGHAYVVIEAAQSQNIQISGYCERAVCEKNPYALPYWGDEASPDFDWKKAKSYFVGIGDNKIRFRVAEKVLQNGGQFVTIIHSSSWVSKTANIGSGVFINTNASVNAEAHIGDLCILNTASVIEHECVLGKAVHIAPGAVLLGNVKVGDFTFIGANAVIKQGISVGKNVVIGAGAVVIRDIPDGEVVVGNPAKKIN